MTTDIIKRAINKLQYNIIDNKILVSRVYTNKNKYAVVSSGYSCGLERRTE